MTIMAGQTAKPDNNQTRNAEITAVCSVKARPPPMEIMANKPGVSICKMLLPKLTIKASGGNDANRPGIQNNVVNNITARNAQGTFLVRKNSASGGIVG